MKKTTTLFSISLLFFSFIFFWANFQVMDYRSNVSHQLQVSETPIRPGLLKALSGEFRGVVADYLLLEAASFVGGDTKVSETQWGAVVHLLDQSSILDPYFKQTYIFAQGILPWRAQKVQQTMVILERSKKHRTWDWRPGFFIGFNYFYFFKDYEKASLELMEAAKVCGAPVVLVTLASRLASKSGQTSAGIDFLTSVYEKTEDEHTKIVLQKRIRALRGVLYLQSAIERFRAQFNRMPDTLNELIATSIISAIPPNPYGGYYALRDGKVEF